MLCRQHSRIDRAKPCIRDDECREPEPQYKIVQNDVLRVIPAQGADDAATPLHRQIVRAPLRCMVVLLHLVKIHRTVLDLCGEMGRYGIAVDVGDGGILRRKTRDTCNMKHVTRQQGPVGGDLRTRERRLVVARTQPRIHEFFHNQPRDVGLADVRSCSCDK